MKQVIIVLPAGRTIIQGNGIAGVLANDTEVVFDVHDADMAHGHIIDPEDFVAQALASEHAEIIPLLTHSGEEGVTVAYTPSGNRVEQTEEAVEAAEIASQAPTPDSPSGKMLGAGEAKRALPTDDPKKLARLSRPELDELANEHGVDPAGFTSKTDLAKAIIAA